jgi:replicative DNA helicase
MTMRPKARDTQAHPPHISPEEQATVDRVGESIDRLAHIHNLAKSDTLQFSVVETYKTSKRLDVLNLPEYRLLRKGTTIIGGEASSGKTTLALQLAIDILLHNPHASLLFFSLDESLERAKRKAISLLLANQNLLQKDKQGRRYNLAHQPLDDLSQRLLSEPRQVELLQRIHICDDPYFLQPEHDALVHAMAHVASSQLILIVDYLQLLPKASYNSPLRENFNAQLAFLKQEVNRINNQNDRQIMLLLLSQVGRNAGGGNFNFRETSEIENMADVALVLEYASDAKSTPTGRGKEKVITAARNLRLVKNKDGAKTTFVARMASDIPFFEQVDLQQQRPSADTTVFRVGSR